MIEVKCDKCGRKIKHKETIGICPDCNRITCSNCKNKPPKHK